jgi:hypothetical protein
MAQEGAAQVQAPLDAKFGAGFDLLRDQLGQQDALGEVFRADDDGRAVAASNSNRSRNGVKNRDKDGTASG